MLAALGDPNNLKEPQAHAHLYNYLIHLNATLLKVSAHLCSYFISKEYRSCQKSQQSWRYMRLIYVEPNVVHTRCGQFNRIQQNSLVR